VVAPVFFIFYFLLYLCRSWLQWIGRDGNPSVGDVLVGLLALQADDSVSCVFGEGISSNFFLRKFKLSIALKVLK
jgi:hypothetical protein